MIYKSDRLWEHYEPNLVGEELHEMTEARKEEEKKTLPRVDPLTYRARRLEENHIKNKLEKCFRLGIRRTTPHLVAKVSRLISEISN